MGDNSGQREGISRSGAWARARVHAAKRATADQRGRSATDSGIPEQPLQIRIHRPAGQARVDQTGRPVLHGWHQGGPGNVTRICFIGGGSYNWMPKLLGDLALTPDLSGEIVLHDISMAEIARTMDRVCPEAWMLNLTNPMTVLTRVVGMVSSIRVVGLCHELMGVRGALMRIFGGSVADYEVRVAGVNHLIWLLDLKIGGQDGFSMLREHLSSGGALPVLPDQGNWHDNFLDRWRVKMQLFDLYGALPAAGDRHLAEFFPYFLPPETDYGAEVGVGLTTIPNRENQVAQARENVQRAIAGELPPVTRSAEATAEIISAVANGRSMRTIVN